MSETKSYNKNFLTMLSGNMMSQVIPFLIAPILTRLFTKEDFAIYANFIAIASMIGIVAAGRLELAIPISKEKKDAQNIVFTGLMLTLTLSLLSVVFPIFSNFFSEFYNTPALSEYLVLIPIAVLSIGLLGVTNNWVLRHKKYNAISFGKVSQSFVNNGLAALLGYIGWGTSGLIIGWLSGQFVGIIILLLFIDRKVSIKNYNLTTIKTTLKEYKDFPMINSLHAFTDIFATQFVLFWIITSSFGLAELGLYAMMHKYVKAPIVLITTSVSSIFYTEFSSAVNEGRSPIPILKKTLKTSMLFSFPFILVLLLFAPQIFSWYLGTDWEIAGVYAQRITPILFMLFVTSPISGIPILLNKQRKAFIFVTFGYTVTLLVLFSATLMNWSFADALLLYSCSYAFFQLLYLYWFYTLLKNRNVSSN